MNLNVGLYNRKELDRTKERMALSYQQHEIGNPVLVLDERLVNLGVFQVWWPMRRRSDGATSWIYVDSEGRATEQEDIRAEDSLPPV